jgi:hypothetical protein
LATPPIRVAFARQVEPQYRDVGAGRRTCGRTCRSCGFLAFAGLSHGHHGAKKSAALQDRGGKSATGQSGAESYQRKRPAPYHSRRIITGCVCSCRRRPSRAAASRLHARCSGPRVTVRSRSSWPSSQPPPRMSGLWQMRSPHLQQSTWPAMTYGVHHALSSRCARSYRERQAAAGRDDRTPRGHRASWSRQTSVLVAVEYLVSRLSAGRSGTRGARCRMTNVD